MNSRNDIRITAGGWEGIFLFEEEAALALAGRPLPDRILESPLVTSGVWYRAASEPSFRQEILNGGTSRLAIARWTWKGTTERPVGDVMDESVKVEVYRTRWTEKGRVTFRFHTAVSGRSYNLDETSVLIDMLQIGYRLCKAAEHNIMSRQLAERIEGK